MGRRHAQVMDGLPDYQVVGVCDLDEERAGSVAAELTAAKVYADYEEMLAAERPDVVTVATPNDSHARFTIMAVEAGACGICCEKPMAVDMGEGRAMIAACAEHDVSLIVAHQRRMGPDMLAMRRLIDEGAIGDVTLLHGSCQGDLLTDGTHLVDSLRWLAGDDPIRWVLGQAYRKPPDPDEAKAVGFHRSGGYRYGHGYGFFADVPWNEDYEQARQSYGRISIAHTDSEGEVWAHTAIDAAWRSLQERLSAR